MTVPSWRSFFDLIGQQLDFIIDKAKKPNIYWSPFHKQPREAQPKLARPTFRFYPGIKTRKTLEPPLVWVRISSRPGSIASINRWQWFISLICTFINWDIYFHHRNNVLIEWSMANIKFINLDLMFWLETFWSKTTFTYRICRKPLKIVNCWFDYEIEASTSAIGVLSDQLFWGSRGY